jgi:hypothetical protein
LRKVIQVGLFVVGTFATFESSKDFDGGNTDLISAQTRCPNEARAADKSRLRMVNYEGTREEMAEWKSKVKAFRVEAQMRPLAPMVESGLVIGIIF